MAPRSKALSVIGSHQELGGSNPGIFVNLAGTFSITVPQNRLEALRSDMNMSCSVEENDVEQNFI